MLGFQHLCRGSYVSWMATQAMYATLSSTSSKETSLWIQHRPSQKICNVDSFFSTNRHPLLLLGSDEIPPAQFVKSGKCHGWHFTYPSVEFTFHGKPGPEAHRRRYAHLSRIEYAEICAYEETLARSIRSEMALHPRMVAIVPNAFIVDDSVPRRLCKENVATVTVGSDSGFKGEYIVVPPTPMMI